MRSEFQEFDFPNQKVTASEKNKPEWYANCIDWIISRGMAIRNSEELEQKYGVLEGDIPEEFYKKILNPYNSKKEEYKRFPATMRNYDLIKGNIRRYVSEYLKDPHDFIVGANNPEVILGRDAKLREELRKLVEEAISQKIIEVYQQFVQEGNDPKQFNPQDVVDVEQFTKEFNENYIDEISDQGQKLLNVIKDLTEDTLLYVVAYFNFVTFGETYTYSDVQNNDLIKRVVYPRDAFPIPNGEMFVEDYDMFAERRKMTYQQIRDEFEEYLSANDLKFLDIYYAKHGSHKASELNYNVYKSYFPELCSKFTEKTRQFFENNPIMARDLNTDLYDVWHVVWRGSARQAIVTYVNQAGMIDQRPELEGYKLNPEMGDIKIEYVYTPQVYEGVRIGTRNVAIYPYKARAIAYNRNGKLPYNGLMELIPGFGKFSIVDIMLPYQVFYNIVAYHREMVLAKNKLNVLMIAKSLLGKVPEDTIYKMIADGVLYIDDENDQGMLRAQQVRMLNASMGDYLKQLGELLEQTETAAKNQVDMTPQRYGEIANSAGKGVTEEAVMRGSMGSVIIEYMMDAIRERDYARDLDFSKLAWIDGLDTSYRDAENDLKYISLNIDNHIYANYVIKAKNSSKEKEKLDQLKQFAFSAAQNGDSNMAIAAIKGDNVAAISRLIEEYQKQREAHEEQLKQMEQQTEQMKEQFELQKIAAKGEEDRKTLELKGYIDQQIELIRADANMISYNAEVPEEDKQAGLDRLEAQRMSLEREKLNVAREKNMMDAIGKAQDRALKNKDIDTKLQIAKTNKNRYDSKSKK